MDKVRVVLNFVVKYHFWFLAGLVVIVSLPLWWRGTSSIAADFETSKAAIEGSYGKVNGISSENPNGKFKEAVDAEHEKLKKATHAAWQRQYEQQTPIFVWPDLPLDFRKRVTALRPTDEIPIDLRGVYQNNIAEEVPKIWERCRLRRRGPQPPRPAGSAEEPLEPTNPRIPGPSEASAEDPMTGVVVWTGRTALESQAQRMRFNRPSTPEIRFFQEDLWVHEVVLRIIDAVNEESNEPYNARIKQITDLNIGAAVAPPVATAADQLLAAESSGPGGMRPGPGGGMYGGSKGGMGSGMGGGEEGAAPADIGTQLENNRYVDKSGAQQSAGSADAHSSGVFKLIPAEMTLTMEEAAVPQLLAACANSPIPVEVRKVTIRGRSGPALAAASPVGRPGMGGSSRSGMGMPLPPGVGGPGKGGDQVGKGGGSAREDILGASEERGFNAFQPGPAQVSGGNEVAELAPTDVEVYLRVHVYVFNPPDPTKLNLMELGAEGETDFPAESSGFEPAQPAATEEAANGDTPTSDADEATAPENEPAPVAEPAPASDASSPEGGGGAPPAEGEAAEPTSPPADEPAPAPSP